MAKAKSTEISWAEIESECGDYRAGFVATFRRYEGQVTDEKDAQGRAVKVTVSSFARHMGIARATFQEWVAREQGAGARRPASVDRDTRGAKNVLGKGDSATIRNLLDDLPPEAVERIASEAARVQQDPRYRAARDEYDRKEEAKSPEQRDREHREAERFADSISQKMLKAFGSLTAANLVEAIDEATADYRQLIEDQALTDEMLAAIDERLQLLLTEHEVARGVVSL